MQEEKKWSLQIGGRELTIVTGLWAQQAGGAVTVSYGDTVMMATATMSKGASRITGYFPLMVDFEERYYAAGKIKGSRFIKREGRPSDDSVLSGRAVDRTIRPLFDSRMRNEVQVVLTTLSYDGENNYDTVAMIAASVALSLSNIPWNGPIAAVRVGLTSDGSFILNPTVEEVKSSALDLLLSGTHEKINMIEAGGNEILEDKMIEAFEFGFIAIQKITEFIDAVRIEAGKIKSEPALIRGSEEFETAVKEAFLKEGWGEALYLLPKQAMEEKMSAISAKVALWAKETYPEQSSMDELLSLISDEVADEIVHENVLKEEKRPDGRKLTEIRPIWCKVGVLPRTHGTGLFTRGETQALTVTTLGAPGDEMVVDTMRTDEKKRYIHFYNFPPYSVGEVRPMRGPGRREIGHGALAEKALVPVLPSREEFPYTIILVSEVLASNGSSSMASTCGSTLSLMDAGVPIRKPVSGIAMGVITGKDGAYKILTDIQGLEDHYGDMDFKVAGTKDGITAMQMDVKIDGLTPAVLRVAVAQAKIARLEILEKMLAVIPAPREVMSPYAPRIITLHINPEKIRDVIGPGGKMINQIIDETGVSIDIEDDGSVFITSADEISAAKAVEWVNNITREVKAGELFQARITRIMNFGAFAEVLPNQEGLIHISELSDKRVENVEDVVHVGDIIPVLVKEIDNQGRINLSHKATLHQSAEEK
ncbi:MAG: polyribonucleotide nucleotidyltransferase [Candidatus Moranbacteria bacterium]|nr:polyribonucleotide nucleotidyltransferase [Candidatus Moranbacteria bacterium]MDD3964656.1 polyribonucleotide nucleotidyltransferase [Candidatus Moranbacteria bacterium]